MLIKPINKKGLGIAYQTRKNMKISSYINRNIYYPHGKSFVILTLVTFYK